MAIKNNRLWSCLSLLCVFMLSACSFNVSRSPSILVIMIDQLGFHNVSCGENSSDNAKANPWQGVSGFQILCNESVRFTHAYTPSTLSVSAAASILTAKFPLEHGLRHNGNQYLSSTFRTVSEAAVLKNYRTSFFSGGPPIFRKSGLGQGFESFEDNIQINLKRFYRPASESIKLFLNWHEQENSRHPFFSMLYFADLQFEDVATTNSLGEVREASFSSQIEYLDESLGGLFQEMKKKKIWDSTNIVVVGLGGHGSEDREDLRALSLYSEGTHVSLFVKPAGEQKKLLGNFDTDISLVDVGATLFDWLGEPTTPSVDPSLRSISFKDLIKEKPSSELNKRLIISESAWSKWRNLGEVRFAIRASNLLVFNDKVLRVFDTLEDNTELVNLSKSGFRNSFLPTIWNFFSSHDLPGFETLYTTEKQKFSIAKDLWRGIKPSNEVLLRLADLSQKNPKDVQLLNWKAIWDLRLDHWKQLKISGKKAPNLVWEFVASRNLNDVVETPTDPCLNLIKEYSNGLKNLNPRNCKSEEFLDLVTWLDDSQNLSLRQRAMESFLKIHADKVLFERVAELNYVVGMTWDISLSLPKEPSISDLILALPENRKYRQILVKRLADLSL